jgi:hypothetical protein
MSSDRVSIKIVDDLPGTGEFSALEKGAELLVDSPTATALVLIGTAIQLPS